MRVAVIGAGIIGVTTAYELAADGHAVTVFERRAGVAAETSFANAGVVAPGYVTPWAAPGMPGKVLRQLFGRHAAVRFGGLAALGLVPWMWRWWQACSPAVYRRNRAAMQRLAHYSRSRLDQLVQSHQIDYERAAGYMVLLRTAREAGAAQAGLPLLRELGVTFDWLDDEQARRIEPALNPATALAAAIHLPQESVGNCRQFAQVLKGHAQALGAEFRFEHEVARLESTGQGPRLLCRDLRVPAAEAAETQRYDAAVVCAGPGANRVLQGVGLELPLAPVHGYSITAPLRQAGPVGESWPRSALMDERFKVAISRLGQRVRVAGSAELGGPIEQMNPKALTTLYRVLDDWFPGAAQVSQAQAWKGSRPMLPDGPPVLGACAAPGVWLNLGHGSSGWALSCGSARVVADLVAGRRSEIDLQGLGLQRLRG